MQDRLDIKVGWAQGMLGSRSPQEPLPVSPLELFEAAALGAWMTQHGGRAVWSQEDVAKERGGCSEALGEAGAPG